MTATTTTARPDARSQSRFSTDSILATATRMLAAARSGWSNLATGGQLGMSREREIGRHTGARI